ncbi:hypothetical protein Tco_0335202, partial [Tanacetum coccineum]
NMEMEPDTENMTISEYLEYKAAKERRLWDDVRSRRSPTKYNEADDSIWEQDDDLGEDQEENGDDEDTFDMWDITAEDVKRIRKFFNVPDEIDEIVQPLIPEPIHTTPPNDDYVAHATKSILDELLEEFGDEILNVATTDEEADPTKDLKELERLLAMRPQSNFTEIQVHSVIINTKPFIHTQLMSPLYGVFKTSKPCKVDRDITSPGRFYLRASRRNMEMEPDIKNMTISEYLEYEATKERRLWDDVRSRRSPTNYYEAGVDSFHRNKSKNFSYPYSHNLTPPHPCFLPVQPYPKNYSVSTNESNDVDIKNMTIAEYNLYVAKQGLGMNPLTENMKRMGHGIVQDSIWEHDDDSEEDLKEDDDDDGDTFDMSDITVEDVERIRKFFKVPDEID